MAQFALLCAIGRGLARVNDDRRLPIQICRRGDGGVERNYCKRCVRAQEFNEAGARQGSTLTQALILYPGPALPAASGLCHILDTAVTFGSAATLHDGAEMSNLGEGHHLPMALRRICCARRSLDHAFLPARDFSHASHASNCHR